MVHKRFHLYPNQYPADRSLPPSPGLTRSLQKMVLCFAPEIYPATARLAPSLQTPSLLRHAPDHMALVAEGVGGRLPLQWLQPRPRTKNKGHLPLDVIPHSMLFLLGPDGLAPLPGISQHLLAESYPEPPEGRTYPQPEWCCRTLLIEEWKARAPAPA